VRMRPTVCASEVGEVKDAAVPKQREIVLDTPGYIEEKGTK
jgi:hypothetical protein